MKMGVVMFLVPVPVVVEPALGLGLVVVTKLLLVTKLVPVVGVLSMRLGMCIHG
jgi:hypothetical protein